MLDEIRLESTWKNKIDDKPITEKANIIALYRFVYILDDEFIEIESQSPILKTPKLY